MISISVSVVSFHSYDVTSNKQVFTFVQIPLHEGSLNTSTSAPSTNTEKTPQPPSSASSPHPGPSQFSRAASMADVSPHPDRGGKSLLRNLERMGTLRPGFVSAVSGNKSSITGKEAGPRDKEKTAGQLDSCTN